MQTLIHTLTDADDLSDIDPRLFVKLLVVGPSGAGKTTLVLRATTGYSSNSVAATVGMDFFSMTVTPFSEQPNVEVVLQVWDIAGQDHQAKLWRGIVANTEVVLIVYDGRCVRTADSAKQVKNWLDGIRAALVQSFADEGEEAARARAMAVPVVVAANKADLLDADEAERCMAQCKAIVTACSLTNGFLVSALNGQNVRSLFLELAARGARSSVARKTDETIRLLQGPPTTRRQRWC